MADQMNIGTLVGYLTLDDRGVDKGTRSATQKIQQFSRTGSVEGGKAGTAIGRSVGDKTVDAFGRSEAQLTSKTKSMFGKLAAVAGAAFAVDKIGRFFGDTIKQASDLNETVSKAEQIFGAQSDAMMKWAQTSDKAFGLSKASALAAAAQFGDMFSQLGFAGDQAASLSQNVVQLAADLGSFNNLETGDVLERIAASMRGEYDSLQLLIPNINAARVQQEAMAESGKTNANALTAQEKAAATLAIIQKDGARASGDFARTSDQLANSQKIAAAEYANAKAEIGDKLLPVMTDLTHFASDTLIPTLGGVTDTVGVMVDVVGAVARAYDSLPGPVKAAAAAFVLLEIAKHTNLVGKLSDAVLLTRVRVSELADQVKTGGIKNGLASIGRQAGAIGVVSLAIAGLTKAYSDYNKTLLDTDTLVDKTTGNLTDAAKADIAQSLAPHIDVIKRAGLTVSQVVDAIVSGGDQLDDVTTKLDNAGGVAKGILDDLGHTFTFGNWASDADHAAWEVQNLGDELGKTRKVAADYAQEQKDAAAATVAAAVATGEYRDAQDDARDAAVQAAEAFSLYAAATSDAGRAQEQARQGAGQFALELVSQADAQDRSKASALEWVAAAGGIPDTFGDMSDEIARFAKQADSASTRLKFFTLQVDELAGRDVSLEEATRLLNDQVRDLREGFEDGTKATKGHIESLIEADGSINTVTEAGSKLYGVVSDYRQAYDAATNAARDHALQTGTTTDAVNAARKAADEARAKFLEQADALGISREDAIKMADAMGILEGKKLTPKTLGVYVDDQATPVTEYLDSWQPKDKTFKVTAEYNELLQGQQDRYLDSLLARSGGHATGGLITGPGTGTSDSILARVSNGEYIVSAAATSRHRGLLDVINQSPGFASGGIVGPTSQQLSGLPAVAVGPILGAVQQALAQFAGTVDETAQALTDANGKAKDARDTVKDLTERYRENAASERQRVSEVAASTAESVASARARLAEAKTADDRAKALKAVTKAEADRAKAIDKARAAMEKSTAADLKKLNAAKAASTAADKEAATAKARAGAVAALAQQSQFLQRTQERLAAQLDDTNTALSAATSALAGLRQQSSQLHDSVAGKIIGDSSITGLNPLSTVQNVIDALANRRDQATAVSGNLGTLAARGLNGQILQDIAGMGLAGGPLAATLAGASASQLSQINGLQAQIAAASDKAGKSVADAIYANDINLWQTQVDYLTERQAELQDALKANADALAAAMDKSLATQTRVTVNQLKVVSSDVQAVRSAVSGLAGSIATSLKASVA